MFQLDGEFLNLRNLTLDRAQPMVRKVVSWLLKRDPSERVTADMAAIMLAVLLWAPAEWLQPNSHVSVTDVNR